MQRILPVKKRGSRGKLKRAQTIPLAIGRYILLISIGYLVLYPVIYMISSSLKPVSAYLDASIIYIPREFTLEFYEFAIRTIDYWDALGSTFLYEMVSAALEIMMCSFIGYGMARFKFKGKRFFDVMLILLILIPTQMIITPMMMNYSQMDVFGIGGLFHSLTGIDLRPNILDTVWTFYLPSLLGVGLRAGTLLYIYIQFFKGLPQELEEAAWIDGAGLFRTFFSIALPSSSVVFTTVMIFALVWHWNDYFLPIMYLSDNFPLAVKIYDIESLLTLQNEWGTYASISTKGAACFLFILPVLVVYLFLQRRFVQSIDRVGITG